MDDTQQAAERVLASLPDSVLDRLAGLIAAKLIEKNGGSEPSKQVVAGSSPISRSKPILTTCLAASSLPSQLARYRLDARARGYSEATITHNLAAASAFAGYSGAADDLAAVTGDDLRRFIIYLKDGPARHGGRPGKKLNLVLVNTYVRAVRSFWSWLEETGAISTDPLARVPAPRYPRKVARVYT